MIHPLNSYLQRTPTPSKTTLVLFFSIFMASSKKMSEVRDAEGRGVLGALKAHKMCSKEFLLARSFFSLLSLPYQQDSNVFSVKKTRF